MKEHYEILGVQPDCSQSEIRGAYKKRAMVLHPDKNGGAEEFQKLNEAYSVLRDPEKRAKYDRGESTAPVDTMHDLAVNRLAGMFQQKAQEIIADPKLMKENIIEKIRCEIIQDSLTMQQTIDSAQAAIDQFKKMDDCVEYTGDDDIDLFSGVITQFIDGNNNAIETYSRNIKINKAAIEMLNNYKFESEESRPSTFAGTYLDGGLIGSGWNP